MAGPPPVGHGKPVVRKEGPPVDTGLVPDSTKDDEGGHPATPPDLSGLPSGWNKRPFRTGFPTETNVQVGRKTTLRTVPFTNNQLVPKLTELLGNGFGDAIRNKTEFETSHPVKTPHGPLEVKVHYKPEYNGIFFTLSDTQTAGTSLRLDLDKNRTPTKLTSIDDPNNIFSGVFADLGINGVSQALGAVNPQAYQKRVESINNNNYNAVTERLHEAKSDPKRRTPVQGDYYGPDTGVFVQQNGYQAASIETPLATAGVNTCSALIVIDRKNKRHYLAHVDPSSTADQIAKSVRDSFNNLEGLEVYVMEEMMLSGTLQNIWTALKNMGLEENLKFISNPGFMSPGIGTQNGKTFNPTTTFQEKSTERIAK